uniref:Rubredoxin-like domain-containing protein n=1 Tax=Eutreptiella gymnastica TaxID=73025 RepID=A0A7S1HWH9_9EUGL|mmetsp:Transcript_110637/g.191780  ORF Transcript_110637/g.191780 Transcript_110637/m.191780 type:complete len:296 (+) Transcript_110637:22-909(+)
MAEHQDVMDTRSGVWQKAALFSVCAVFGLVGSSMLVTPTSTPNVSTYMTISAPQVESARAPAPAMPMARPALEGRGYVAQPRFVAPKDAEFPAVSTHKVSTHTLNHLQVPSGHSFEWRLKVGTCLFLLATACIETARYMFGQKQYAMATYSGRKMLALKAEVDEEIGILDPLEEERLEKQRKIQELKAQEKFMRLGTGKWECQDCTYQYNAAKGDPNYPIAAGTQFEDLPADWQCPTCGAPKSKFKTDGVEVAGFEANQSYGLGTNSMTGGQKSILIYGALIAFFALFISGYALD